MQRIVPRREVVHGLVWTVDAVGFSRRELIDQVEVIEFLSDRAGATRRFEGLRPGRDYIVHSTGDGFIVTLIDWPGLAWQLVKAAADLVRKCRSWRIDGTAPRLRVRQGLHAGIFMHPVHLFDGFEAVGDALNRGSRVADAAGPDQIYVSEAFVEHIVEMYGKPTVLEELTLYPPLNSPPHKVPIKHGSFAGIRHVVLPGVDWHRPSPTLMRQYETEMRLKEQLRLIQLATEGSIAQSYGGEARDELQVRVSIWEVAEDRLLATRLRLRWDGLPGFLKTPAYRLDPPEGPLARAVATSKPVIEVDLPTDADPAADERRSRELGLLGPRFSLLGRRPGALVTVPYSFGKNGVRGAICVDVAPSLADRRDVLRHLATILLEREGEHIASLMQLRQG